MEKHVCYYCGNEAKHQLKNGKWCCKENARSCESIKKKVSERAKEKWKQLKEQGIKNRKDIPENLKQKNNGLGQEGICYYCGQEAHYQLKNGRWCCCKSYQSCPELKMKNSSSLKEKWRLGFKKWNGRRKNGEVSSWNKGLTKETDERVAKRAKKLKERYKNNELVSPFKGKHWSENDKKRISEQRKKYLDEHPEKVPYLLNHSSKISYPERYFRFVFKKEKIDLEYHVQISRYQLDFCDLKQKKYIEIDGESHYVDKKTIKIDKERTEFLEKLGWKSFRIRWKDYKKLNLEERGNKIKEIENFIALKALK